MKEDQLQKEVLVPLFVAMGFQDVTIYQGTSELGKDIVMWKPGDLGERFNYAVVASVDTEIAALPVPISGQKMHGFVHGGTVVKAK